MKKIQHPLYTRWRLIRYHTTVETSPRWHAYGGRGIKMKPQWEQDFWRFAQWVERNLGLPNGPEDFLDRIDNDQGYYPGNLCWATAKENSRRTRSNTMVKLGRRTHCLSDWCDITGITMPTILGRLNRGLTYAEAFEYKPNPRIKVRHYQWK